MPDDIYIGIDPGAKGAAAAIHSDGGVAWLCAFDHEDIVDCLLSHGTCNIKIVGIEKVHAMPGQGLASTFSFGKSFGEIIGIMKAMRIPYVLVAPQTWKRIVLKDTDRSKEAAIAYCRARWPRISLHASHRCRRNHTGIADALCIAEFVLRSYANQTLPKQKGAKK